jgi:hypothetical protein
MLKEVEASASIAPSRQRKKKRGRLLYSTSKALNRSRMRKSNVVQCFIPEHVNTTRVLDFQTAEADEIPSIGTCSLPNVEEIAKEMATDDADIDEENEDQVSFNFQIAFLLNSYCLCSNLIGIISRM